MKQDSKQSDDEQSTSGVKSYEAPDVSSRVLSARNLSLIGIVIAAIILLIWFFR